MQAQAFIRTLMPAHGSQENGQLNQEHNKKGKKAWHVSPRLYCLMVHRYTCTAKREAIPQKSEACTWDQESGPLSHNIIQNIACKLKLMLAFTVHISTTTASVGRISSEI